MYWKVNVDGTKAIIAAAQSQHVRKLVYTSSAGVVFNGNDLINVDERSPMPAQAMDAYNESKVKAEELVLGANGQQGLLTVSLRPAGIFGYVRELFVPRSTSHAVVQSWRSAGYHWFLRCLAAGSNPLADR